MSIYIYIYTQGFGRLHSAHARAGAGALPCGAGGQRAAVCCFVIYNLRAAPATIHTATMALDIIMASSAPSSAAYWCVVQVGHMHTKHRLTPRRNGRETTLTTAQEHPARHPARPGGSPGRPTPIPVPCVYISLRVVHLVYTCAVGLCAARIWRRLLFACMANFSDPEDTYRFCHQMVHMPLIFRSMYKRI